MNVGFRPRLKAYPSLYDLIAHHSTERLSAEAGSPVSFEDLPPLPVSASPTPISPLPLPVRVQHPEPETQPAIMAPKKAAKPARDADIEEQYGELTETTVTLEDIANLPSTGSIYSVSGYATYAQLQHYFTHYHVNS